MNVQRIKSFENVTDKVLIPDMINPIYTLYAQFLRMKTKPNENKSTNTDRNHHK